MTDKTEVLDTLEIGELEYDVASVGAEDHSAADTNQAALFLVFYRLPENQG